MREEFDDTDDQEDLESNKEACWQCGRKTEEGQQFDTEYCSAKWAEDHDVPWFPGGDGNEDGYLNEG